MKKHILIILLFCYASLSAQTTDCSGAIGICNDATVAGGATGIGLDELNATSQGCLLNGENQATWFGFSPTMVGSLTFTINVTAGTADYDFAIWGPFNTATCPVNSAPLRCSYSDDLGPTGLSWPETDVSEPFSGNSFVDGITFLPADVGKVYYLLVDNWSANAQPYTLDWTLSSPTLLDCTPPLPIILSNFNGTGQEDGRNYIYWTTASEHNNDYFSLERSKDAIQFEEIARVDGSGNSNTYMDYGYYDTSPYYPITYYRLVQVDFDGTRTTSPAIVIENLNGASSKVRKVYPSPFDGQFNLELTLKQGVPVTVEVVDMYGKTMYNKQVEGSGDMAFVVEGYDWGQGVYILRVTETGSQVVIHQSKMIRK